MSQPLTQETFTRALHRALHHLYDPVELRLNPLAGWLDLARGDTPSALRAALLQAIAALKPGPRVPEDANAWRVYQVLCYRFEEQSSQDDVAAQMAVSARQVRRLEQVAIRALSSQIAAQHDLHFSEEPPGETGISSLEADETQPAHEQELEWLRKSYNPDSADVYHLVESALKTGQSILASAGASVSVHLPDGLPAVHGQATTLRQVLLNLLLAAAGAASHPSIDIECRFSKSNVDLLFSTAAGDRPERTVHQDYLTLASQLAQLSGGAVKLAPPPAGSAFMAILTLPIVERLPILFVDDNEDSLRLFERSLAGTRFHFIGARDPLRALDLAIEGGARVIILDIMLPDLDGWEILGRIRAHPKLGAVPVVISTILPHEQLALSLGASGFLRKPVSREALLDLLNRLLNHLD